MRYDGAGVVLLQVLGNKYTSEAARRTKLSVERRQNPPQNNTPTPPPLLLHTARQLRHDLRTPLDRHLHQLIRPPILGPETLQARVLVIPPLARVFRAPDIRHDLAALLGADEEHDDPHVVGVVEEIPVVFRERAAAATARYAVGFGGFATGGGGAHCVWLGVVSDGRCAGTGSAYIVGGGNEDGWVGVWGWLLVTCIGCAAGLEMGCLKAG